MNSMRVIMEARENGKNYAVDMNVRSDNWLDESRNAKDRRDGIISAANALLRGLSLDEIEENG